MYVKLFCPIRQIVVAVNVVAVTSHEDKSDFFLSTVVSVVIKVNLIDIVR